PSCPEIQWLVLVPTRWARSRQGKGMVFRRHQKPQMRHPSCFLVEARTEVLHDKNAVNVDESSLLKVSGIRKQRPPCALRARDSHKRSCAVSAKKDKCEGIKRAPPHG